MYYLDMLRKTCSPRTLLCAKTLLPQHGPDQLHPATLQHSLAALGHQAWPQKGTTKKAEKKIQKDRRLRSSFKKSPQSHKTNLALRTCHQYCSFQPHQQAGTTPKTINHIQDGFNFVGQDEQGFPQS